MTSPITSAPPSQAFRTEFSRSGFVLLEHALPLGLAAAWQRRAGELVHRCGISIHRESDGSILSYRVVTGEVISREWPELFSLYTAPQMLRWVAAMTGSERVFLSRNTRSAININSMDFPHQAYRWHYDAQPFTLLLFLTTSTPEDGGAFELSTSKDATERVQAGQQPPAISILPKAGSLLLMDGTRCLHRAAPLLRQTQRLTVPMVYPAIEEDSRPAGLDDYLYSAGSR